MKEKYGPTHTCIPACELRKQHKFGPAAGVPLFVNVVPPSLNFLSQCITVVGVNCRCLATQTKERTVLDGLLPRLLRHGQVRAGRQHGQRGVRGHVAGDVRHSRLHRFHP